MSKKILVLKGSPRKNGNSDMMADAWIKGAETNGHQVKVIRTADCNLSGCRACNGCWNSGGNCVIKDDMTEIEKALEEANVLVVASPLYWSMVPSELKAVFDRIYQYDPQNGGKHLAIEDAVLLSCGETESEEDFDMIKKFFAGAVEFNGMKVKQVLIAPNMNHKGDITGSAYLKKAEELGLEI